MLLVRTSIRRTGLLTATTLTVKGIVAFTFCPGASPLTKIVGADTLGLVGSNTLGMIRLAVVVCPG